MLSRINGLAEMETRQSAAFISLLHSSVPRRVLADRVWRGPTWSSIHGWYSISATAEVSILAYSPAGHSESVVFEQFGPVQPPDNAGPLAR
jgi:hypothetical protein